ncbi:hypothetical protein F0562_010156 [Nyssa sinensis]|uniref:Uncharacterized protein n=1 Tax=Nyssa sinensis TaxID=561372 RepID=A0A5J4ZY16_9ASTE|nr:hypothetical protein F0562_010156 [Nyssa sinensis]
MGSKDGMFRYADRVDKLLMLFGSLGSIGDGLQILLMMFVLSNVINGYGSIGTTVSISSINKSHGDLIDLGWGLTENKELVRGSRVATKRITHDGPTAISGVAFLAASRALE